MILPVIPQGALTAKSFADLSSWRRICATGNDALVWLDDLLTADLRSLRPGLSEHALLLDDSGGLRADVTVAVAGSTLMILQDPAQTRSILDLLSVHTEGTDVDLEDRTAAVSLFSFPARPKAPDLGGTAYYSPSCLGPAPSADLTCLPEDQPRLMTSLAKSFVLATPDDLEAWRIAAGRPRMGVDVFEGDLPQEAGLMGQVSLEKGHFLGRDALRAIDETTPLRVMVVAVGMAEPVSPGERILVGGEDAGELTSVTGTDDGVAGIARIWWEQREGPFTTQSGVTLTPLAPVQ